MDERQLRILDDLRDIVTGEILVDELGRGAYSTDASILQVMPAAVVAPRTVEELAGVVRYAAETGISIHPRGAGTGLAGESLGPGVVVDTSLHLTKIGEVTRDTVRVEPGVRWSELQKFLARTGRRFAPDPVSGDRCTLGGMAATDASGPHALRYGTVRDYLLSAKVVLATGEVAEIRPSAVHPERLFPFSADASVSSLTRIELSTASLLRAASDIIAQEQPESLLKPGGYNLRGVLHKEILDLPRLLVGSEGTLAVFAELELATLPLPPQRGLLLACFPTTDAALQAAFEALEFQPTACELLDRRLLSVAREVHPSYSRWISDKAEALVLFEQEGSSGENVRERLAKMAAQLKRSNQLIGEPVTAQRDPELSLLWDVRNLAIPRLARRCGHVQPVPFVENTAVPPAELPKFLKVVREIMRRHNATASYSAHPGVGILHTRPLLDLRSAEQRARLGAIARDVQEAVLSFGGTNHGEHGAGLIRSHLIPEQFPKLYPIFRRLKEIFDPSGVLNPGRIVGAEPSFPMDWLRIPSSVRPDHAPPQPQLVWHDLSIADQAVRCNGCGSCRTADPSARMCPSFRALGTELASPRSKANLLRQIVYGQLEAKTLATDEFRAVADLCVQCKMCRVDCPSGVDISKLMLEAKAANVSEHGMSRFDRFFAEIDSWLEFASRHASLVNPMLRSPFLRWVLERFYGLSRQRKLPPLARRTFLQVAQRQGWTRRARATEARPRVAFVVDSYDNFVDPATAECAVQVLEKLGRFVYVPPEQGGSGMAPLHQGDVETARRAVRANLAIYSELVRDGYEIVTPEPAAALMLRSEARDLLTDPDIDLVARHTYEFTEYVSMVFEKDGFPSDLRSMPFSLAYHEPCLQRALAGGPAGSRVANLLASIPDLKLEILDLGCSGMAGTHGLRVEQYGQSLLAGQPLRSRFERDDIQFGVTQCSACRLQIEGTTGKRTLHPAAWLAMAMGIARRPDKLLRTPGTRRRR